MIRACLLCIATLVPVPALAEDALREAMEDYTGFAPYDAGIILPAQITKDIQGSFTFIDTRTADEYTTQTIKDAQHIEWREVFARLEEIPTDRKVILFCNTGALSAQAAFGLRIMGYENVLILQTGFDGWQAHHAAVSQ